MPNLEKIISRGRLLEVGASTGDITEQLADISGIEIDALEFNKNTGLAKRFVESPNVNPLVMDYFNMGDMYEYEAKYDTVLFKEWFNAFDKESYQLTLNIADKITNPNGKVIIIDYFPRVLYRQLICACALRPWRSLRAYKLFRSQKANRLLNIDSLNRLIEGTASLSKEFQLYSGVDPLNLYDNTMHKALELIVPCKFCAVIHKN